MIDQAGELDLTAIDHKPRELDLDDAPWLFPEWTRTLGFPGNHQIAFLVRHAASMIRQCQQDGIEHVAPICLALRGTPAEARKRAGKAVWRTVHHSSLDLNTSRADILLRTRLQLADVIHFPKGALRDVRKAVLRYGHKPIAVAGLISTNRNEFRQAAMLAGDTLQMGGELNSKWSMRRLREEHDRNAQEVAVKTSNPTPWDHSWSSEIDGYTFTLLKSATEFVEEGLVQRHCIASYVGVARMGRYVVMRVEGKERATARLSKRPIRVDEVKAHSNRSVSRECYAACRKAGVAFFEERRRGQKAANG